MTSLPTDAEARTLAQSNSRDWTRSLVRGRGSGSPEGAFLFSTSTVEIPFLRNEKSSCVESSNSGLTISCLEQPHLQGGANPGSVESGASSSGQSRSGVVLGT